MQTTFTALDFETANYQRTSICQVGLVRFKNGKIVFETSRLVRPPGNWFRTDFTEIHGIHSAMTNQSPDFASVWPEMAPYIDGQAVVAHNGHSFDFDVLRKTLAHYGIAAPAFDGICTYRIFRSNLADLCAEHGIALNHHDALSDARACGWLYLRHLEGEIARD